MLSTRVLVLWWRHKNERAPTTSKRHVRTHIRIIAAMENQHACIKHPFSASLIDLITDEMWGDVMTRLLECDDDARLIGTIKLFGTRTDCYPLHALCKMKNFPLSVLTALTTAMPAAVRIPAIPFMSLPIHIACRSKATLSEIEHLVSLFPESLHLPDADGNLPIHLACSLGTESVVKFLASLSPESVRMTNSRLQTPLHLACNRYDVCIDVVEMLLKRHPNAAMHQDWQRQVPLHKAVAWKADIEVIGALLNAFPEATRVRDKRSLTPYKIGRKLIGLTSDDSTIKLLRMFQSKNGRFALRTCDFLQFGAETVRDKVLPTKRARAAMAA